MKKTELIVTYGNDIKAMTRELLEAASLAEMIPSFDTRIGIKPNLVDAVPAEEGSTTHPEIVEELVSYLKEYGFHNICILEGSWVGGKTAEAFEVCGYEAISKKYGVPLIDTQAERGRMMDCGGMDLKVCESVEDISFLINVPVLKGHCQTRMTCALKNMKGLIPNSEKRRFHSLGLHRPIAHLNVGIHQDFILVDSICGDPVSEDGGHPFVTNRMYAAADPVLCDVYGCQLLGRDPEEVAYIGMAEQISVGSGDLFGADIRILHEAAGDVSVPESSRLTRLADNVEEVDSCSACYAYLMPALDWLEQEGLLEKLKDKVCIGQGFRGKHGNIGVGNCTCLFTRSLKGCPPLEHEIYDFLKELITEEQ